jgi:hypothetical protein
MQFNERQQEEMCSRQRLTQGSNDAISLLTCFRDKQLTTYNVRAIDSISQILRVMAQMSTINGHLRYN